MKYTASSLEETEKIAKDFVTNLQQGNTATVVGLYGNLGAGKTTFTQSVAREFGITETVVSPTFVIEKIYELTGKIFSHLVHIDAYRLEHSDELMHLGWEELISDKGNLVLIEWPERVLDIMPSHIKISLSAPENTDSREIEVILP